MIEIENLSKAFQVAKRKEGRWFKRTVERVHALEQMSFHVNRGEIVGYIGPNGAGKSTTIKIMSGILVPTSGRCEIMGLTPWKSRVAHVRNIGVVFGQRTQLWWDLPVVDSFSLIQHIYKISDSDYRAQLEWLTRALDLKPLLMVPVRQLSLGQRMRCEIAAALLHRPSVLFLDEPTIGLDAVSKVAVRSIIKKINADQGVTVILTTHDMSDIEALASRVVLIGKGRKLYDGQLEVLKSRYIHTKNITVDHLGLRAETTFSDYLARGEDTVQSAVMRIASNSGCHLVKSHLGQLTVEVDLEKSSVPEVIQQLTTVLNVLDISVDAPAMDDVIVKLYKDLAI